MDTTARPHVLLSVAASVDGFIDDAGATRLLLSGTEDFDRVDAVRAGVDAILVGAQTLRADNPRLLVGDAERRAGRTARGRPEHPLKVTISGRGDLSRDLRFWHHGGAKRVYTTQPAAGRLSATLAGLADVVALPGALTAVDLGDLLDDLGAIGVRRLMVEGGSAVHTQFLAQDLADELHYAIAPILVGDPEAPRFLGPGAFPAGRMELVDVARTGDVALLRYLPKRRTS